MVQLPFLNLFDLSMMNALRLIRIGSAMIVLPLVVTQCALPPRDAWRTIQSRGLFTYWAGSQVGGGLGTPYRPDMLGSGLRYHQPAYSGRYAEVSPSSRYNSPAVTNRPSSSSSNSSKPRAVASSNERKRPEPTPQPKPSSSRSSNTSQSTASSSKPSNSGTASKSVSKEKVAASSSSGGAANSSPPQAQPKTQGDLPFGKSVAGRPGLVTSPYAGSSQLVDVTGMSTGQAVKCPYTGKLFKVPPPQQAAKSEPAGDE